MKLFGLGVPELVIILIVVLLIFGPKNLPKLGSALGKSVKNLKAGMGFKKKTEEAAEEAPAEEVVEQLEAVEVEPEVEAVETAEEPAKRVVKRVVKKSE